MKRAYLVCAGLCLLLASGCFANAPLSVDPHSWDFGQVKEGQVLQHSFVFRNDSGRTLNINNITTSCGCTTANIQKNMLLPGETTFLEVSFNTKGYSGPTQELVYVNTDSLDDPILTYTIKAEVVK
jgi:hypothetical protein